MVRRLLFSKNTFAQATLLLGATSLLSRLLGLVRDRLFASTFGAGNDLDSYYAAFRLPDLVFNLLILGAISAAFIPVFTELTSKGRKKEAEEMTNSLFTTAFLALSVVAIILWIFASELTTVIAPGFSGEKHRLTTELTRIMLLSPILFGLSSIAGGVLNSVQRFLAYALAPVLYNLGIIGGVIFLVPRYGVRGVAYGVVLGALLHLTVQLIALRGIGFHFRPTIKITAPFLRIFKLMWPRMLGLGVFQISDLIDTIIASTLAVGSVAVFNLADNLQSVVIGIVGISIATAIFPVLATHASQGNRRGLVDDFSAALKQLLYITLPLSLLIILLRAQIVRVILGAGHFSWEDTQLTAAALGVFSLSLFAQSAVHLLLRAYYALQDTRTPLWMSALVLVVHAIGSVILALYFGVVGLAAANSIESFAFLLLLLWGLEKKLGFISFHGLQSSLVKTVAGTILAGATAWGTLHAVAPLVDMQRTWGIAVQGVSGGLAAVVVYLLAGWFMRSEEQASLLGWLRRD